MTAFGPRDGHPAEANRPAPGPAGSHLTPEDLTAIRDAEEAAEAAERAARPAPVHPRWDGVSAPMVMHPASAALVAARRIVREAEALIAAEVAQDPDVPR